MGGKNLTAIIYSFVKFNVSLKKLHVIMSLVDIHFAIILFNQKASLIIVWHV